MSSTSAYVRIIENLQFLKSKESLKVIDQTLDYVNANNMTFVDGFLYFTETQVEQKKENLIKHSVLMAGFPKSKTWLISTSTISPQSISSKFMI